MGFLEFSTLCPERDREQSQDRRTDVFQRREGLAVVASGQVPTPLHKSELGNLTRWHPIAGMAFKISINLHRIYNPVGASDLVFLFNVYFLKSGK